MREEEHGMVQPNNNKKKKMKWKIAKAWNMLWVCSWLQPLLFITSYIRSRLRYGGARTRAVLGGCPMASRHVVWGGGWGVIWPGELRWLRWRRLGLNGDDIRNWELKIRRLIDRHARGGAANEAGTRGWGDVWVPHGDREANRNIVKEKSIRRRISVRGESGRVKFSNWRRTIYLYLYLYIYKEWRIYIFQKPSF